MNPFSTQEILAILNYSGVRIGLFLVHVHIIQWMADLFVLFVEKFLWSTKTCLYHQYTRPHRLIITL